MISPAPTSQPGPSAPVSRETSRRRFALAAVAALALFALFAAACSKPASPSGWASARPLTVAGKNVVLVAHKANLYALPEGSSNELWQFPPKTKDVYPVSEQTRDRLNTLVDALPVADADKTKLKQKVADLTVNGATITGLKDAVDALVQAPGGDAAAFKKQQDDLKTATDAATSFEKGALDKLQAFYGDFGLSSDGKTVFVVPFRGIIFALDVSTGHTRWVRDSGDQVVGGIAVDGNTLYFGTKGKHVFAVDATTGERNWQFDAKGQVWDTPTIDGDTIYVSSLDGSLYALDKSGKQKWVFRGVSSGIGARPVVAGDFVYIGAFDNKLYAVSTADGTEKWSLKGGNWFWATPVFQDSVLYAANLDGKVYAVDARTGTSKWAHPFTVGSAIRSGPVIAGGGLLVAGRNGHIFKLDLASGTSDDGGTLVLPGVEVLADLVKTATGESVYVVPSTATLYEIDATGKLGTPGSTPLPQ
jgi:outer membrane protein assembly factor BamB